MFPDVSESLTPTLTLSVEEGSQSIGLSFVPDVHDFFQPRVQERVEETLLPHAMHCTKRTLRDDDDVVFNRMCTRWQ
jgi:hypothetical protein